MGKEFRIDELEIPSDITTHNASTTAHGFLPKLPGGTTTFLRADGAFAAPPGGGGGNPVITTTEVNLGVDPRRAGRFLITTSGLTAGKPVPISKAHGPYTGKGSRVDEAEMDMIAASGKTISATQVEVFWHAASPVKGNVKFDWWQGG